MSRVRCLLVLALVTLVYSVLLAGCAQAPAEPTATASRPPAATPTPTDTPRPPTETPPPTPTPVPPTETTVPSPTPVPPTATAVRTPTATLTPSPTPVLASSAGQIVGTWQGLGMPQDAMFQRYDEDGTCRGAFLRSDLSTRPNFKCTYRFEGTDLVLTEVSYSGVPPCRLKEFVYRVELLGDTEIRFVAVRDTCRPRMNTYEMRHKKVE